LQLPAVQVVADEVAAQPDRHAHARQPDGRVGSRAADVVAFGARKNRDFRAGQLVGLDDVIHAHFAITEDR